MKDLNKMTTEKITTMMAQGVGILLAKTPFKDGETTDLLNDMLMMISKTSKQFIRKGY